MKKALIMFAIAAAFATTAYAATDMGVLVTSKNIDEFAKVTNGTGANSGTATVTIADTNGTAQSVTVYNKAQMDTKLDNKADVAKTLAGYGITNAYISAGKIVLGDQEITPLTSFTETDPNVPDWAKAETKPTYSYSEITDTPTSLPSEGSLTIGDTVYNGSESLSVTIGDLAKIGALTNHQSLAGYVPTSRTVAGKALSSNVTLDNLTIGAKTYNGSTAVTAYATDMKMGESDNTTVASAIGAKADATSIPTLQIGGTTQTSANTVELGGYYVAAGSDGKPHLYLR